MPIEDSERNELLDMSRDWQAQLNCLWGRVEELGYKVFYDSEGKPAIKDELGHMDHLNLLKTCIDLRNELVEEKKKHLLGEKNG